MHAHGRPLEMDEGISILEEAGMKKRLIKQFVCMFLQNLTIYLEQAIKNFYNNETWTHTIDT